MLHAYNYLSSKVVSGIIFDGFNHCFTRAINIQALFSKLPPKSTHTKGSQFIGSCCINWPDIEECEVRATETLGLAADERPVMFLAVGYADSEGEVPYSEKVPAEDILVFKAGR